MTHRKARARLGLVGAFATALAVVAATVTFQGAAFGSTAAAAAAAVPASTVPAWTGDFDSFHTSGWNSGWGLTSDTQQCDGASGSFGCNWGYGDMQAVSDPTAPGGGQALKVTYPANSGPPSCYLTVSGCVLGGGQFYQDLTTNGQSALAQSPSMDLKYYYNFPVGFDFGKKTAGKMPGLWGGGVEGCESGSQHCAQGWSTRYMWRGGSASAPDGELYFYTASGSGFGADLCLGDWTFPADGKWHSIEQLVNIQTGSITVWSDGKNVCQQTEPMPGAFSGVFFSTFHGGHDLSWSPSKSTTDEFADFTLSTDGPQSTAAGGPATPANVTASAASSSSIALSWTEANNSDPATSYKVHEGSDVVATVTGTSATITGLAPGSTHTYTVTALDASGVESGSSASATATTSGSSGGGGGLSVTLAKTKDWGSGFTVTGTLTNNSGGAITGWDVQFDLDSSESVESSSGASYSCSAHHCTLTNRKSDATIAAGASLTFKFNGAYPSGGHYIAPTNVAAYALGAQLSPAADRP